MMTRVQLQRAVLLFFLFGGGLITGRSLAHADATTTIDDLNAKIAAHNATIEALDTEIAGYQAQLTATSKQKLTLQETLTVLADTNKKLLAQIKKTEAQIAATNLELNELAIEIADKQTQIGSNVTAIEEIIRAMREADANTTLETMLTYQHLSDAFNIVERLIELQESVSGHVHDLQALQSGLQASEQDTVNKKNDLVALQGTLADQEQLVAYNAASTKKILAATKNKEANYQKVIEAKLKLKDAFQQELYSYESQLKLNIDQSALPIPGPGVLHWPLDTITITQRFGMTAFAQTGAYNGKGHNGVDFAAAIGTPVKAALTGTVVDTGNTDLTCPGASYGKWILLRHDNGLSTLYAHLSLIKVTPGEQVNTGDVIGYSGFTGYATGPHLHFTVYATQGVQVIDRPSVVCHATYHMPVADLKAYLDPLLYL